MPYDVHMSVQSQRPLVNKLLACEPLHINGHTFTSIDAALRACNGSLTVRGLAEALNAADVPVSIWQLYKWRREIAV